MRSGREAMTVGCKRKLTMRAWSVARSIFDAPFDAMSETRSERADNRLDKRKPTINLSHVATKIYFKIYFFAQQARQRLATINLIQPLLMAEELDLILDFHQTIQRFITKYLKNK